MAEPSCHWPDTGAVKATLQRLREDGASQNTLLEQVRKHLVLCCSAQKQFVLAGGVQVLCSLLSSTSTTVQSSCAASLQALALNQDLQPNLLETVLLDRMCHAVRTSRSRRNSSIRQTAKTIIRLLAGWRSGGFLCVVRSVGTKVASTSMGSFTAQYQRDRPLPLWCHATSPLLPWDAEAVSCLVEILCTDLGKEVQETSERIIGKILHNRENSGHIILKKRDVANLVGAISSMHSSALIAMEAMTIMCIMDPSNEITFIRTGGFQSLVQAIRSDNIGNICGEIAAWSIAYFGSRSSENCKKIVSFGGAEALVELLHSPDMCAREASARACVILLRNHGKSNHMIRKKFGDANAIPALLSALRDGQNQGQSDSAVMDLLWTLLDLSKTKEHRKEILDAGGLETLQESAAGSGPLAQEMARKLRRVLLSKSARLRITLGSLRMNCRFTQKMSTRLCQIFCSRADIDLGKSTRNEIAHWICGNNPVQSSLVSSRIQTDILTRSPRCARSTVSLTSLGVILSTSNRTQPLDTRSSSAPRNSHENSRTASFQIQESPVNFRDKKECRESDGHTSVHSPSMQDLAVVVVTLTTQSSMLSGSQNHGNFMDSSQSNLIATCDFI